MWTPYSLMRCSTVSILLKPITTRLKQYRWVSASVDACSSLMLLPPPSQQKGCYWPVTAGVGLQPAVDDNRKYGSCRHRPYSDYDEPGVRHRATVALPQHQRATNSCAAVGAHCRQCEGISKGTDASRHEISLSYGQINRNKYVN